jgi:GMP synthase (glutamine-hydrolysing)
LKEALEMKSAIAIRFVHFEDLGSFETVLTDNGFKVEYVDVTGDGIRGLDPLENDLLVSLGGPIGAYEDDVYPALTPVLRILERRLAADRPTLGICLGAQLIARALGARVYPGGRKEIGWSPLRLTEAGDASALRHLGQESTPVLHWHGDTFDLPSGAALLASSEVYAHQAFSLGPNVLALQFHPEVTPAGLESWYIGHTCEIAAAPGVTVEALRAAAARFAPGLIHCGHNFLTQWLQESVEKAPAFKATNRAVLPAGK